MIALRPFLITFDRALHLALAFSRVHSFSRSLFLALAGVTIVMF